MRTGGVGGRGNLATELEARLTARYGALLTLADLVDELRFSSHQAVAKARRAGRLPFRTFKVPHRRGWHAAVPDVAAYLASLLLANEEGRMTG